MRFSRTNMRLAAARCRSLSRKIGVQTAEFSITGFCWQNADSRKSRTYERHNAEIRLELFNLSLDEILEEPIVRQLMARDGVTEPILRRLANKIGESLIPTRLDRAEVSFYPDNL